MFSIPNPIINIVPSLKKIQKLAVYSLCFFLLASALIFYPIREVFIGNAKLEQHFTISLPQFFYFLNGVLPPNFSIRYYAICILFGLLSGYCLTLYIARQRRVAGGVIDRLLLGITICGLIGARIFYVFFNLNIFTPDPISILYIWLGGLSIFGAIFGAILYLYFYCRRFKFNFFEFLDLLSPGLVLGQIFGRFGNFFNYESYGPSTSVYWKMFVPQTAKVSDNINQDYFHPTFLYEAIPNIFLLILLLWFFEKLTLRRSGLIFSAYAIGYGAIRFFTEFFRLDALSLKLPTAISFFSFTFSSILVSQIFAVCFVFLGGILFLIRRNIITTNDSYKVR